jgi:hypothetical protein
MVGANMEENKVGFIDSLKSVFMAFLGVQSSDKHERDFNRGSAQRFIIAGVVGTIAFVLIMWFVVSMIMKMASAN